MTNPIIVFANSIGVFIFIAAAVIYVWIRGRRELALHTLFTVGIAGIITIVLKELFLTPRPFIVNGEEPLAGLAYLSSFPSAHAAVAFAAATTIALHSSRLGLFLIVIAGFIGLGRVAADVHYPIDIAFGVLVGVTIALFFEHVHIYPKRKNKARLHR